MFLSTPSDEPRSSPPGYLVDNDVSPAVGTVSSVPNETFDGVGPRRRCGGGVEEDVEDNEERSGWASMEYGVGREPEMSTTDVKSLSSSDSY